MYYGGGGIDIDAVQSVVQPAATRLDEVQPAVQPAATRPGTPRRSPRKKSRTGEDRRQEYPLNSDDESDKEPEEGLLRESTPSGNKVKFPRQLGRMTWCCKHAWTKSEKCQLAYCMRCKPVMMAKVGKARQGGNDMLGKTVLCCDKGKCGSHTLSDLGDMIDVMVEQGYLRSVRKEKNENGWQNMPEVCWNCGDLF